MLQLNIWRHKYMSVKSLPFFVLFWEKNTSTYLVISQSMSKTKAKIEKTQLGSKHVLWKAKWKQNSLHRNCVCVVSIQTIECIKRIEFCGKDKVFLPAKSLGSFFINRQVLVGLFSTLSFRGRMLFREITDVKFLLLDTQLQ